MGTQPCRGSSAARQPSSSLETMHHERSVPCCGRAISCLLLLLAACGCAGGDPPAPRVNSADDSIAAAMAELAPEDRALAETQGICPVSNEKLGSMGKPYAVEVKGRKVFLCCQGCEDALRSEPDKYLEILDEG